MAVVDKHKYPSVHCGIVQAALILLTLDQHPAAKRYSVTDAEVLIKEAAAPDRIGDRQQGRGFHYYCAVRPNGAKRELHPAIGCYQNGRNDPAPSPLTMMHSEYRAALTLYRAGRHPAAMRSLTRALHMLADICCPPHTCTLTYYSRYAMMHKRYEGRAAQLFWAERVRGGDSHAIARSWASECVGRVPYNKYVHLLQSSVQDDNGKWKQGRLTLICNKLAESGAEELPAVLGDDEAARDASIIRRLTLSIIHCAAMLAAFDRDADDLRIPTWQEKQAYWLCSAAYAFSISESPLFLRFYEDGDLSLSTADGRYLAVTQMGRVILTKDTRGTVTRFRFGREPMLTLYPDGDVKRCVAWIRGQPHVCKRISHLLGDLYLSQIACVLTKKKPENVHFLFP